MIDISKLNKNKTYVGWQVGSGFISQLIQKLSKDDTKLPQDKIASHIFILVYIAGWQVVEAHAKFGGVHLSNFNTWLKDYDPNNIYCAPCDIDTDRVLYYIKFNPGYSIAQICKDALKELTPKKIWNDCPGVVCSELFANCEKGLKTCYLNNLPTYFIKPVHIQNKFINSIVC